MKKGEKKFGVFPAIRSSLTSQARGQMRLSFGMIFSIILIIVFLAFTFYAIQKFLYLGDTISVGKFSDDLQKDVGKLWKRSQGSQEREYFLPKKIEKVCFIDFSKSKKGVYENFYEEFEKISDDKNLFFYPIGSAELNSVKINHIHFGESNPDCFENKDGKVKIFLQKNFGDTNVLIASSNIGANY